MPHLLDRTGDLVAFTAVIDKGSITAAAESLSSTPSSVSRALSRLEDRVGTKLVRRTTRRLDLTPEGELFYHRVLRILADLEEVESVIRKDAKDVRGKLRVNVSVPFAIHELIPRLTNLRRKHPLLQIDLILTDAMVNLIEERADVAIRIAPLSDSTLFSRTLTTCSLKLVASPDYLQRKGTPTNIEELKQGHEAISFIGLPALNTWQLRDVEGQIQSTSLPYHMAADSGEGVLTLTRQGHGIALLSSFLVRQDIEAGTLVEVLADKNATSDQTISAVYTDRIQNSARLKAFLEFLSEEFGGNQI